MIISPGLPDQIEWFEMVNPAEELVKLCRYEELPAARTTERRAELVTLLSQLKHLVPSRGHPPAAGQAREGADEPESAGEETVQERVVWQVERLLPSEGKLTMTSA